MMNAKRTFYAMSALLVILFAAIFGAAYGAEQLLKKQAADLLHTKAEQAALDRAQVQLVQAKKDIKTYSDLYKISKVIVPQTKDQTQAVRQIVSLADQSNVKLQSITFPASTLGNSPAGASASATPNNSLSSNSTKFSQLTPVKNIAGVYTLQLTVTSDPTKLATYAQLISFLSSLEQNRQTALVSNLNISPNAENKKLFSFTLTLDIYIKP